MTLDAALRRAIRNAPCSIRALARAAGVSHTMLSAIVAGSERATPRVAARVVATLDHWANGCYVEARNVETAILGHQRRRYL